MTARAKAVRLGLLVCGLLAAACVHVPSAYARTGAVTVTWPDVTRLNPDTTAYAVHVDNESADAVFVTGSGSDQVPVPSGQSDVTVPFGWQGKLQLAVTRCVSGGSCHEVSTSPVLQVYSSLVLPTPTQPSYLSPAVAGQTIVLHPEPVTADPVSVQWTLTTDDDAATQVASGSSTVTRGADGSVAVPVTVPPGTADGTYRFRPELAVDTTDWGHLTATGSGTVVVDGESDPVSLSLGAHALFPVRDHYRDRLDVYAGRAPDHTRRTITYTDAHGHVVRTTHPYKTVRHTQWNGLDDAGALVPEGRYAVRVSTVDRAGNVYRTDPHYVQVSNRHLVMKSWSHTVSAQASLVDQSVGACSTLSSPSSHGWAGSLGWYSQTRCRRSAASVVVTVHALHVPRAFQTAKTDYGPMTLSVRGGHAVGTRAADAYAVTYLRMHDKWQSRVELRGDIGTHAASWSASWDAEHYVQAKTSRHPYVQWSLGLTDGSRYDVKSFTVALTYRALTE